MLRTTRYFEEQVLRKRPYIRREWCERIIAHPVRREVQADGGIRYWRYVEDLGERALGRHPVGWGDRAQRVPGSRLRGGV
jgi:hypothetical protein